MRSRRSSSRVLTSTVYYHGGRDISLPSPWEPGDRGLRAPHPRVARMYMARGGHARRGIRRGVPEPSAANQAADPMAVPTRRQRTPERCAGATQPHIAPAGHVCHRPRLPCSTQVLTSTLSSRDRPRPSTSSCLRLSLSLFAADLASSETGTGGPPSPRNSRRKIATVLGPTPLIFVSSSSTSFADAAPPTTLRNRSPP